MRRLPEKPPKKKSPLEYFRNKDFRKYFDDPNIEELITDYNKRYLYYSELKHRIPDKNRREFAWHFMKRGRSNNYEKIKIKNIEVIYSLLSEFNKKLHQFDKQLAGNIQIKSKSLNLQDSYIISSLMEEAIASSQLEGASTTRKVAKAMLREKRKPKSESEKMIINNYDTMQFILSKIQDRMTPEFLLEIQKKITSETLEDSEDEGRFRDNDDIAIANDEVIAHIPPEHRELEELIKEFCNFANNDSENFIHPIVKGILLHFLIGYIHPFNDGNGRTARSVFYWYMLSNGYWLFEYMPVSKRILRSRKKYDLVYLYTEFDDMDATYFIKYLLECIDDTLTDMINYIKNQQKEQEETKKLIEKNPKLSLRQALILEEFMKKPAKIFTIKEIMETYGVVYQTARSDLLHMAKNNYISKKLSGKTFIFTYK